MAKKIMQDIVKTAAKRVKEIKREFKEIKEPQEKPAKMGKGLKKLFWFCVIIAVIILMGVILVNFSSATIKITPHQEFADIDRRFTLNFQTSQLEKEDIITSSATGVAVGGQKASGQIVIYNTYSSKSQKLLIDTRLSTKDGKIYKTSKAVVVPGNGSIEVAVYADKTGPEYNIGLSDFTIVGFKGTAKYAKIYGRSKTEIKGGTKENAVIISEKDIASAKNNLKQKIETYLRDYLNQQKPADYILYKNAVNIEWSDDPANPKAGDITNSFNLREKGKATGYLLKKDDLSKALTPDKNNVSVINLDELNFNLLSQNAGASQITFSIKGKARLVSNIDMDSLTASLLDIKDKNYKAVFEKYPEIERVEIIFSPSWWPWLPSSKSRIHFEMVLQ